MATLNPPLAGPALHPGPVTDEPLYEVVCGRRLELPPVGAFENDLTN